MTEASAADSTTLVIGIAGGTGAGKTTIADRIAQALPQGGVQVIRHDSYYRDRSDLDFGRRQRLNFDHPEALDTELLVEHLMHLKSGNPIQVPHYDFETHRRTEETTRIDPAPVIIVEGILAFVDAHLRAEFDIKLFVDTEADVRAFRRINRDMSERGRDFQSIKEQYYRTVRPMHEQFVEPSRRWADLIIPEGGHNEVAIDLILARLLRHVVEESR